MRTVQGVSIVRNQTQTQIYARLFEAVKRFKCEQFKIYACSFDLVKRFKCEQFKKGAAWAQGAYKTYVTKPKRKPDAEMRSISSVLQVF